MKLAGRLVAVAAAMSFGLVLVSCSTTPAPSPSTPTGPLPSPTAPLGPNLTATQFTKMIKVGKLGDRTVKLESFPKGTGSDPDNEDAENQEQSQALSCVKMNKVADEELVTQAADEEGSAVVQLFSDAGVVVDLFGLNQKCAAEQAEIDSGTAVKTVETGQEGSAMWWLIKDPEGNYQATVGYGNVLAYVLLEGPDKPVSLVTSLRDQVDEVAKK
ncbi:MAG: hypothetical protein KKB93_07525 [Actinobacteria bacterium]|nr:hypothetical protein [Actinomycetota bacterium]